MPKLLLVEQKVIHVSTTTNFLECDIKNENSLKTIITGDESWVYGYDTKTKAINE